MFTLLELLIDALAMGGNETQTDLKYTLFDFSDSKNMSGKMVKSFESDFDPLLTLCDLSSFIR